MNKWSISTLLALAIAALSGVVLADNKTLPGSACVGANGGGGYRPQTGQFLGTQNDAVYCPVIRDNTTTRLNSVWVRLTPGTQANCALQSVNTSDSDHDFSEVITQVGGSIRFDGVDLEHYSGGAYFVNCGILSSTGGIASIRWDEPSEGTGTEVKVAPGLTCQSSVGDDEGNVSFLSGAFLNQDQSLIAVACPIFREQGLGLVDVVDVRVDPGSGGFIDCYVYAQDGGAMAFDVTPGKNSSGGSNQLLSFDLDGLAQFSGGSYALRCNLPLGGTITNVRWTQ